MWEEKKSKCKKKTFFSSVLKKKWMIKEIQSTEMWCCYHNLVAKFLCLLLQKKLSKTWFESETKKKMFDLKRNALIQRLLINTSLMTWSPCCDRMKLKSNSGVESHWITCPSLSVDGDSTKTQWLKWRMSRVA